MKTGSFTAWLIGMVDDRYYMPWVKGRKSLNGQGEMTKSIDDNERA